MHTTRWAGTSYSASIWGNRDALAARLQEQITSAYLSGRSHAQMAEEIRNEFGVNFRQAERLIRTETSYVSNQASMLAYGDAKIDKYEFLSGVQDGRMCKRCAELGGQVFAVADAEVGKNMPPMHPWCRCTTVAAVDEDEAEKSFKSSDGYIKLRGYDFDDKIDVEVKPEVRKIVDGASKKVTKDFPILDQYLTDVGYGNSAEDGNPAAVDFVITPDGRVGQVLSLNRHMWNDVEKINTLVRAEAASGGHIVARDAEAVVTHEYGHVAYNSAVLRKLGHDGNGVLNSLQRQAIPVVMGEIAADVKRIAAQYPDLLNSKRSTTRPTELVAEAFSDYYSGQKGDLSKALVNYFKEVFR